MARPIAPKRPEALGQPVVVDSKPGAAGRIEVSPIAEARPECGSVEDTATSARKTESAPG